MAVCDTPQAVTRHERERQAHGTSLWLAPEPPCRDHFRAVIRALAGRLGTVPFEPHVTLLAGLPGEPERVAERASGLAAELHPLALRWRGPRHEPEYFRAVFLQVEPSEALLAAHERAARHFGRSPDAAFFPHLSLVYAHLSEDLAAGLCADLGLDHLECLATSLEVVHTQGPPEDWRVVGSFSLRPQ